MEAIQTASKVKYTTVSTQKEELPLVIEPNGETSVKALTDWLNTHKTEIATRLTKHGAILMRGFDSRDEADFEEVAKAIEDDLQNNYLGTSPRNSRTNYVFNASELPNYYPIMQHCEMSFLKSAPRRVFFFCKTAPHNGGETPIVDFRKIYQQMDVTIREEFEKKGIRNIRNYNGPSTKSTFDMWKVKRWDEMFKTINKKEVEASCRDNDLEYIWKEDDKLALINEQDAFKKHPISGEKVWFNHLQVFHKDAAAIEYSKISNHQNNFRSLAIKIAIKLVTGIKNTTKSSEELAMHCTFKDGTEIPKSYIQHIEDIIWKNMVIFQWQVGDILAIDNFNTSHGRLPYKGPREILVAWSS